ncbi:MAG: LptF/LptG family permease [Treponema sp.]|nr:LptF/LptG family permease [Treponema sp.]
MKLVKYIMRNFLRVFFLSLVFFVLILCLTDLLLNIWNYISRNVPPAQVGQIMLYYIPKTIWYAVPIAVLFATVFVLSNMYANNELLAVFASGVSLFRFTLPLLITSILLSFGLFYFEDNLVVDTYAKKVSLQEKVLNKAKSLNRDRILVISNNGKIIYKADYYDDELKRLFSLFLLFRDENRDIDAIVYSNNAMWEEDHWVLSNETCYLLKDGSYVMGSLPPEKEDLLTEEPTTFQNNSQSVEELDVGKARLYIQHLEKAGLPSGEAKSVYYKKYAFPCIVFIVVFLAIGLSGKTRKNVLLVSLALSICAVVLFYVMQMVTMLMAKFGTIPPLMGAWFPVVFFVFVSIVLLRYART